MDHQSVNSSSSSSSANLNKDLISLPPPQEESGWTSYLENFSKGIEPSHCSSSLLGGGSSLLSDAASNCPAWNKFSHQNYNNHAAAAAASAPNLPKKLCFKKAIRAKQISEDDPLEDTASSPVNSPKVGDLNSTEIVSGKIDGQLDGSMGKGSTSSGLYSFLQTDDDDDDDKLNFKGKSSIDCTDLKKRGLCLVPLSMFVNYLG